MTDLSQVVQLAPATEVARGSRLALNSEGFKLPQAFDSLLRVTSAVKGWGGSFDYPDAIRALSFIKHEGALQFVKPMADKAAEDLKPVEHGALVDRLTLLGMSMANGKDADQVRAWLHETARLLSDLPQGVLFDAIDECVKEPGRVFVPSVGEIRQKAALPLRAKELAASRLRYCAKLIDEGVGIPDYIAPPRNEWTRDKEAEPPCTPEEAAAILKQYGFSSINGAVSAVMKRPPEPTRADYIAQGIEPPPLKAEPKDAAWDGMP